MDNVSFLRISKTMNYTSFDNVMILTRGATITLLANWACAILGLVAVLLNSFVIVILASNRKLVLRNVFYFLVFHCSLVEWIQAVALIAWCLPSLNLFSLRIIVKLTVLKQWIVMFLRCINMLTIMNLLLFTVNEFFVVTKPLLYRRVRRRMVAALLACSWLLSFSFGIGNVLSRYFRVNFQSVFVPANFGSNDDEFGAIFLNETGTIQYDEISSSKQKSARRFTREPSTFDEFHFPVLFATIVVCLTCLVIVVSCYAIILKRVRRFHRDNFHSSFENNKGGAASCNSRKISANGYSPSVYRKISSTSFVNGNFSNAAGSVGGGSSEKQRRTVARKNRFSRHKYLLVIGSVLLVDVLFIVPYSTIQVLQYLYLSGYRFASAYWWTQPRWILQLLIGLHSVLQPLCYFRMNEFRRFATCRKIQNVVTHT